MGAAATAYVEAAFGEGTLTECAASACWILSGRTVAFDRLGVHTALVVAGDVKHAGELARAATADGLERAPSRSRTPPSIQ